MHYSVSELRLRTCCHSNKSRKLQLHFSQVHQKQTVEDLGNPQYALQSSVGRCPFLFKQTCNHLPSANSNAATGVIVFDTKLAALDATESYIYTWKSFWVLMLIMFIKSSLIAYFLLFHSSSHSSGLQNHWIADQNREPWMCSKHIDINAT